MREVLALSRILRPSSIAPGLVTITRNMLQSQVDPHAEFASTWANEGWVFGSCLQQLARFPPEECAKAGLVISEYLKKGIDKWASSECVMIGLVELVKMYK